MQYPMDLLSNKKHVIIPLAPPIFKKVRAWKIETKFDEITGLEMWECVAQDVLYLNMSLVKSFCETELTSGNTQYIKTSAEYRRSNRFSSYQDKPDAKGLSWTKTAECKENVVSRIKVFTILSLSQDMPCYVTFEEDAAA